jgi:hypothetical protein
MERLDSKVVDLNLFKAARAARQLDLLEAAPEKALQALEAGRPLSERDVAHRARMLAHLASAAGK